MKADGRNGGTWHDHGADHLWDCDGVLIDSELIACAMAAACPMEIRIPITVEEIADRYRHQRDSHRFGARRVFVWGLGAFVIASTLCALAPSVEWLILGRVLQGVGGSILVPSSLALISRACGDDRATRTKAIGWWTAGGGVAITAGPIVGACSWAPSGGAASSWSTSRSAWPEWPSRLGAWQRGRQGRCC